MSLILLPLVLFFFGGLYVLAASGYDRMKGTETHSNDLSFFLKMTSVSGVLILLLINFTHEDSLMIKPDGGISLIEGHTRLILERKAFLDRQAGLVDAELRKLREKNGVVIVQESRQRANEIIAELQPVINKAMQQRYMEHPEERPTRESALIEEYRRKADALEQIQKDRQLAAAYNEAQAEKIRQFLKTKQAIKSMY